MAFNCDSVAQFLGDASVNRNPDALLLDCLSTGDFDFTFTPDEVLTLCEAECCPPASPSTLTLFSTDSFWSSYPSTPASDLSSVPSSPSTTSSVSPVQLMPGSSCPSSPSAVCPTSPFSYPTSPADLVPQCPNVCCSMFVPCSRHGNLTPEEEQIVMQKRRYRQDKLERYRMKRSLRNFNKRVNENRSRVAQQRARDEHGHFISAKKRAAAQHQMREQQQQPRAQTVPDLVAPQWDSPCAALPIFF